MLLWLLSFFYNDILLKYYKGFKMINTGRLYYIKEVEEKVPIFIGIVTLY